MKDKNLTYQIYQNRPGCGGILGQLQYPMTKEESFCIFLKQLNTKNIYIKFNPATTATPRENSMLEQSHQVVVNMLYIFEF